MKSKPDDRRDNVEKIQQNINSTIRNMEMAHEMIDAASDPKARQALDDKNKRRKQSLDSMRSEIKDEASDRENGYRS